MSLLTDLIKRGGIDGPDFYVDLPSLPACPDCGDNAAVYVSNGTDLVCIPCSRRGGKGLNASSSAPGLVSE